jgi:hypothetical protein
MAGRASLLHASFSSSPRIHPFNNVTHTAFIEWVWVALHLSLCLCLCPSNRCFACTPTNPGLAKHRQQQQCMMYWRAVILWSMAARLRSHSPSPVPRRAPVLALSLPPPPPSFLDTFKYPNLRPGRLEERERREGLAGRDTAFHD